MRNLAVIEDRYILQFEQYEEHFFGFEEVDSAMVEGGWYFL